ncbi:hypothetical protein [Hymenobacter latericus]|uniref:hypothetical protein n=1 Tax=Hymenobacter sp. YIM 151858-1 TaxID=2987688 RepID=UPI002225DE21|nr:hypothetical protein [Hymenobacter sp. YIM 151858-1]UYZ59299.1 hypothetical protein OIS50_00520 [Hymenobacter sp. YIM 151858-1]
MNTDNRNDNDKFDFVKDNSPAESPNLSPQPENLRRGAEVANQPEGIPGQTANPGLQAPHQQAPNYGDFGKPENAQPQSQASTDPQNFQPYYGQETPPEPDDTRHGDARFRQSGTRNWETNEPENPHLGSES